MTKKTLGVYWQHSIKYTLLLVIIAVTVIATTILELYRPFFLKYLLDDMGSSLDRNVEIAMTIVYMWVGIGFVKFVVWRGVGFANNRFQPRIISNLMNYCYRYILGHSYNFFTNNFSGSIQTRLRKYAYAFETVADQACFEIGKSLFLILMLLIFLLVSYWQLGLIILAWVTVYFGFSYKYTNFKLKYDIAQAEQDTTVTAHLSDTLSNHSNINLFAAHDREMAKFEGITQTLYERRKLSWDLGLLAECIQGLLMIGLELAMMTYAINAWGRGTMTLGDVVLVQAYLARVFDNTWSMGRNIRKIYEQLANANEMSEMLDQEHEVTNYPTAKPLEVSKGTIDFSDVSFGYGNNQVFDKFSFRVEGGRKVALVGDSGGGKTTLVKLVLRLLDVDSGQIKIDGQNIGHVTQDSLHKMVTLVPQDPSLFHRSLRENIMYGNPEASEAEMIHAAQAAHCHEFISKLPYGYDTLVGERGIKLSGGQRQRVAIARAILANSPILIFDEATSSLDSESESYIQDALRTLMKGKTSIVIAHRLSTIKEMDWIVVIEDGKIIEQGTHRDLLGNGGKYWRHWNIQSGGFVLDATATAA